VQQYSQIYFIFIRVMYVKITGELTQLLPHDEIYETLKYLAGHGFINHESSSKVIPFRFSKLTSRKSIFLDLLYLSDTNDGLVDPSWSSCFQSLRKKDTVIVATLFGMILRKTTTFLSLKDMFRQNFCHLQLNE